MDGLNDGNFSNIVTFGDCISEEERKQRFSVTFVNVFAWIIIVALTIASGGALLIIALIGWLINLIASEYNIRLLQAIGATASENQFSEVYNSAKEICERFNVKKMPRVIILQSGDANAFSIKFARKKVVVVLSGMLEGIIGNENELKALLAHEICHSVLDHGNRGIFEVYKPAKYKAAREHTCDIAGLVASEDLDSTKTMLKKLCVGKRLFEYINEESLLKESEEIYSGLTGWFIASKLTHPPYGKRLEVIRKFTDNSMMSAY